MRSLLFATLLLLGGCSMKPDAPATAAAAPPDWNGVWLSGGIEMNVDGFTPVDPKPPLPRSVSPSSSESANAARVTGATTS